jgi:hypothetical protein
MAFGTKPQKNWSDYIKLDPEIQDRFIIGAFAKNPHISSLQDLKDAIEGEPTLSRATNILDDFAYKDLFESESCKSRIRQNITEDEFNDIYGEVETGTTFIQRKRPVGQSTTAREVKVITLTTPAFSVSKYLKQGREVKGYQKHYAQWSNSQVRFIAIRKLKGISTKQIAWEYNSYFKQSPRTESSIKTKISRTHKISK